MIEKHPIFISTAIDYVNGLPHVGHALEKIQADVLARWYRQQGHPVFFLTGTDEHSLSNVRAAEKAGQEVTQYIDAQAEAFRSLGKLLDLSFDRFIRTTEPDHVAGAQKFWQALDSQDVSQKAYHGLYCVGCEEFKLPKDLDETGRCPDHLTKPEPIEETNYFFKLSRYQDQLLELIDSGILAIEPAFRKNEVTSFIRSGLEDFSISRSVERAKDWGIPVPGDPTQIMYVWVDALSNYITGLGYAPEAQDYQRFWAGEGERMHVIGKGILRFHAIYWPALLLSAGLPLPTKILVHEYLTINHQKISKTIGNVIAPQALVDRYGTDAMRYLLLRSLPYERDGDVSLAKLDEIYMSELANTLGNLLSRVIALRTKFGITDEDERPSRDGLNDLTREFKLEETLIGMQRYLRDANLALETAAPWSETDLNRRDQAIRSATAALLVVAQMLTVYLPSTAESIVAALKKNQTQPLFPRLGE